MKFPAKQSKKQNSRITLMYFGKIIFVMIFGFPVKAGSSTAGIYPVPACSGQA
jgi:hypothetical protein